MFLVNMMHTRKPKKVSSAELVATVLYRQDTQKTAQIMLNSDGTTFVVDEAGVDVGFAPATIPVSWDVPILSNEYYIFQFADKYVDWVFEIEGQLNGKHVINPNDLPIRPTAILEGANEVLISSQGGDPWPWRVVRPRLYNPSTIEEVILPYLSAYPLSLRFSGHPGQFLGIADNYTIGYDTQGMFSLSNNGSSEVDSENACSRIGSITVSIGNQSAVFNWESRVVSVGWDLLPKWAFWGVPPVGFTPDTIDMTIQFIRPDTNETVSFKYPLSD